MARETRENSRAVRYVLITPFHYSLCPTTTTTIHSVKKLWLYSRLYYILSLLLLSTFSATILVVASVTDYNTVSSFVPCFFSWLIRSLFYIAEWPFENVNQITLFLS